MLKEIGFISGDVVVQTGEEHVVEFLRLCETEGLHWATGSTPLDSDVINEIMSSRYGNDLCIRHARGGLHFCERDFYIGQGKDIIVFNGSFMTADAEAVPTQSELMSLMEGLI